MTQPPVAPRHPHVRTHHGDEFVDEYEWLREKDSPEVIAHLDDGLVARLNPRSGAASGAPLRVAVDVERLHFSTLRRRPRSRSGARRVTGT